MRPDGINRKVKSQYIQVDFRARQDLWKNKHFGNTLPLKTPTNTNFDIFEEYGCHVRPHGVVYFNVIIVETSSESQPALSSSSSSHLPARWWGWHSSYPRAVGGGREGGFINRRWIIWWGEGSAWLAVAAYDHHHGNQYHTHTGHQ